MDLMKCPVNTVMVPTRMDPGLLEQKHTFNSQLYEIMGVFNKISSYEMEFFTRTTMLDFLHAKGYL